MSVVIVSYHVRAFLEQALRSVERASAGLRVETFVVDNASSDGTPEMVREQFPGVHLIANEANVGFGAANNQAIRRARGRCVFILNPDTILEEGTLSALVGFLDARPDAGAVGPMILNPDGTFAPESRRAFPTPEVALYRISGLSRLFPRSPRFGRYNLTHLPREAVCEVDALSGACIMARRSVLTAISEGDPPEAFDEGFFMYGEDLDLCFRIQQSGAGIFYTPETRIIHYKGESTKKGELRYVRLFYGAMLRFAEKHFKGDSGGALLVLAIRMAIVARAAIGALRQAAARARGPALDAFLAAIGLGTAALVRLGPERVGARFVATVGLTFVAAAVAGVALAGGYRRRARSASRSSVVREAVGAALVALAVVSTLSFYLPAIAFSRATVLLGALLTFVVVAAQRMARRTRRGPRRAVVVGSADEAARLAVRLAAQPRPPFVIAGYVAERRSKRAGAIPYLGPPRALRDLVRFEGASDVLFSATTLPASVAFAHVQDLADLPIEMRMIAPDGARVIGKASVDELGLVDADEVW